MILVKSMGTHRTSLQISDARNLEVLDSSVKASLVYALGIDAKYPHLVVTVRLMLE